MSRNPMIVPSRFLPSLPHLAVLMSGAAALASCTAQPKTTLNTSPEPVMVAPKPVDTNPLTQAWTGPFDGVPPWDKMQASLFPDAFTKGIAEVTDEIHAVRDNPAPATFHNVHVPMMLAGAKMDRLFAMWGVQSSNLANEEVGKIDAEWSPKLQSAYDELLLDPKLFVRYKAVYDNRHNAGLTPQQLRIVERSYEAKVREGSALNDADRAKLIDINAKLAGLFADFSAKLLKDEDTFVYVTDKKQLAGLPDDFIAALADAAKAQGKAGQYAIKNTRSAAQPVLQYASDRALREHVYRAFVMRGDNNDANDTKGTIAAILKLRQERATLLGFANHAEFRMADTMAKTPAKAMALMMKVWPGAVARVREEVADMQTIINADARRAKSKAFKLAPWDYLYYAEKVRKAKYDLSEDEVKPYLELGNMMNAMFYAAGRLYGMEFKENTGAVPVFDPEVRTFEVLREGKHIGLLYIDNYARKGKRSGAWMTTYRDQHKLLSKPTTIAANNNNFTKGADGQPTLISLDDASTLFHEFGHGIHYLLQDITYPDLAEVPRDFVEYPSQVNENWLLTRDVLDKFAVHYKTGKPMPQKLVDKILASQKFNQGFSTVEYLASAIVDMKLHDRSTPVTDVAAFEKETLAAIGMPSEIVMRHRLPQFGHLFSSDAYSAGYYSYLWSETMDADTWAAFTEAGSPWDKRTADRFRTILLQTGNETDRATAYRAFRGRDPDVNALLRKRGFPVN